MAVMTFGCLSLVERCCVDSGDHAQAAGQPRGEGRGLCGRAVCRLCPAEHHDAGCDEQAAGTYYTCPSHVRQCNAESGGLFVHCLRLCLNLYHRNTSA